ncbi:RHS repeat-associated core domain-containing protein [Acinetobacter haemolyticus]|uniref:RHS repeat domain-containing protein n=1 Tax=Acinetobacter haemolyticus TaxID=29430 RepID=UPI002A6A59D5|nr:RHS repeat-associated core domain-containing protein [Acinetobacter haemolyticus]WPO68375.1 RHS repeat-associated core domain-containing protein [Acinetobacter haemolyticus]
MKNNISTLMQKTWLYTIQIVLLVLLLVFNQTSFAKDRIQYHVQNFDGSTIKVINEQGIVSQSYQYAPFGQQLQLKKPSNLKNPNAFVGGVQDAGDLVYLKHRHYNPVLGRFYQPDPITFLSGGHGQTNRYQYGWNDSYHFTDSNGKAAVVRNGVWVDDGTNFYSASGGYFTDRLSSTFLGDFATLAPAPSALKFSYFYNNLFARSGFGASSFVSNPTIVYRTMYENEFLFLKQHGRLPSGNNEKMISPTLAYAEKYRGVTVEFIIDSKFYDNYLNIAARDSSKKVLAIPQYANLPPAKGGWWMDNALSIKSEKGIISLGLGRGPGLELFNNSIIRFREVSRR